ncbi:nucleotide sugar dehydrogenase [Gordonia alkanivorans]|uniref:nucleotide sugar dehydrogenase n=1 Tax=Gordonia alkanivorans TaxID=84096 RepID=UPI00244B5FBB|nr:nucleotide sugar dehydrogenase [Gordonia alkanivorans]MDH3026957.1 nucleotide sugar dehydrogenase [Gordonia alkanivorans]
MKIAVVGLGYVGVTAAACLASDEHEVVGVDVNASKVESVNARLSPISEPGIDKLIAESVSADRLAARVSMPVLDDTFDLVIVCVGTPSAPDGSHNMTYIAESSRQIAESVAKAGGAGRITVAFRSTFVPGTMSSLVSPIFEHALGEEWADRVELVYNPEFLREGSAINDFKNPPKVVVGTIGGGRSTTMDTLNSSFDCPIFNVEMEEAEITKFIDNTWHALKVSYANEIGRIASSFSISAKKVSEIFLSDTKLNISPYYLRPGGAFGGSCLPKDVRALEHIGRVMKVDLPIIDSVMQSNAVHKDFQFGRAVNGLPDGARIALLGLAFKAKTDDLRESPHVDLAARLLSSGYQVKVFDPELSPRKLMGQNLAYTYSHLPALDKILVSREEIETGEFDRILECTPGTADGLDLVGTPLKLHEIG